MCNCTADGLRNPDCNVSITTRQVCQDEVLIAITSDSNDLKSALSFESGTTYYLISEFNSYYYHEKNSTLAFCKIITES